MVQTQRAWMSELSSATGRISYGTSTPALQVLLPEHLVSSCSLGQVVHIIGHAGPAVGPSGQQPGQNSCVQASQTGNGTIQAFHPLYGNVPIAP